MPGGDAGAVALSFAYILVIVGVGEAIRKRAGLGVDFTRKVVHVGVGIWIVPTLLLFEDWRLAALTPAVFILLTALSYLFRFVPSIEQTDRGNVGTILFPLAFVVLIGWLWPQGRADAIAGGILVLALGDAAAAMIGRRFGRHRYRILGATRSWEGSTAMFALSLAALVLAQALFASGGVRIGVAAAAALVATALEAGSPWGFDNLLVPVGTAGALLLLS
jgi:phytol kinase